MGSMAFHGHANSPNHPISPKKSCKKNVNTHTMGPTVITIALNPNTIKARLSSTPSCVCVKTFWSCVSQNKNNRNKSFNFKKAPQNKTVKSIGKSGSFQQKRKNKHTTCLNKKNMLKAPQKFQCIKTHQILLL